MWGPFHLPTPPSQSSTFNVYYYIIIYNFYNFFPFQMLADLIKNSSNYLFSNILLLLLLLFLLPIYHLK